MGIRLKLLVLSGALAAAGFLAVIGYFHWRTQAQAEEQFAETATAIARLVDSGIPDERHLRDVEMVWNQVQKAIWLNPDVLSIDINSLSNGQLATIVSSRAQYVSHQPNGLHASVITDDRYLSDVFLWRGEKRLRIVGPIHSGRKIIGTSELVLTMEQIHQTAARNLLEAGLIILVIFAILGGILLVSLRVIVLNPVSKIARATQDVATGDLARRVEVRGHDELASLASHLNRMTVSLESAITDLRSEIDARKVAEARLLEAHHELERRVQQRTRALNRAKDDAENASKAKSQFLSRMSHELRTPLNAILGFGQMLNRDPEGDLSDKKRGFVDRILSSGDHLLNMINEVLDLSRIESEALSIEIQTVSPRVLLDECLEQITAAYVDRYIRVIDLTTRVDLPMVYADPARLRQVLLNLLTNAIKYNGDRGEVTIDCQPADSDSLRIWVSDTGPGIPVEKQRHLFEPFERLGAEKSDIEGTGIGLSIARQLIEHMGGKIGFTSEEGAGSTFWIDIPVSTANRPDDLV